MEWKLMGTNPGFCTWGQVTPDRNTDWESSLTERDFMVLVGSRIKQCALTAKQAKHYSGVALKTSQPAVQKGWLTPYRGLTLVQPQLEDCSQLWATQCKKDIKILCSSRGWQQRNKYGHWNRLPRDIIDVLCMSVFKRHLDNPVYDIFWILNEPLTIGLYGLCRSLPTQNIVILFYSIVFYSVLLYCILFNSILFYSEVLF